MKSYSKSTLTFVLLLFIFSQLEAQETIFRINTGGTEITYNNEVFIADTYANTGNVLDRPQTGLPEPFQTFRFSRSQQMSYDIPVPDGEYTVKLYFAELWFGATGGGAGGAGSRIFDVTIEGQLAEDNLDVFAEVGADAMLMKSHLVTVSGGVLNIDFDSRDIIGGERHPIINAIEVISNTTVIPDITIDPIVDQSNAINETISLSAVATGGDAAANFNFTISGQPEGVLIDENTGAIAGIINTNAANGGPNSDGVYQVTVTASKTGSSDATMSFEWTITDPTCVWNPLADANIDRFEAISQKIGDKLYVLGGFKPGVLVIPETEIYDTTNDIWTIGASMPLPVTHTAAVAVGTDIWILGGFAGNNPGVATNAVQVYNTLTDSWSVGPDLPNPIGSAAGALSGTKIHFFGGLLPDRQTDVDDHLVLDLTNLEAGWTSAAPMPNARNHHSGISVNGIIYAIGGQIGHDGPKQDTKFVHSYDPSTDTWTRLADLARTRSHFKAATTIHNGKVVIVGGIDNGPIVNDISVYDPELNIWTELCKLPGEGLEEAAAQAFGDRLIVSGGRPERDSNVIIKETKWLQLDADTSQPPLADAGEDQTISLPVNEVTFNGSGIDPDGGSVSYLWSQISGPSIADVSDVSLSDLTTSNLVEGTYVFRLTVIDDENESVFDEVSVVVNTDGNLPLEISSFAMYDGFNPVDENTVPRGSLEDGDRFSDINLPESDFDHIGDYTIVAVANQSVQSVKIELSGLQTFSVITNDSPFFVGNNSVFSNLLPGIYSLTGTPYSGENATGDEGKPYSVSFEIYDFCQESYDTARIETAEVTCEGTGGRVDFTSNYLYPKQLLVDGQLISWQTDDSGQLFIENLEAGEYVLDADGFPDYDCTGTFVFTINENSQCTDPNFSLRINTGGPEVVWSGDTFIADQYRTGGLVYAVDFPINDTTNDELYQTEIYSAAVSPFSYEIPVPNTGIYDIRLHFAELYFGVQAGGLGSRVFDVSIEGNVVLSNFDILSEVAPATALIKEFNNVQINDGFATIQFIGVTQRAKISGIEILGQGNTETDIPVITLIGESVINLELGDVYTELGATAIDDTDGDLTAAIIISGDAVETNSVGTYVVTYDVSDSDSNDAERLTRTINVTESAVQNSPDINVNLALLNDAVLSGTDGSRGSLEAILYDPVSDDYFVKTAYNEYGVGYLENLGRPDAENGFVWRVDWSSAKLINYITFGGVYPNQPQPNTAWRVSYLNNGNWTVIEEGQGGWIDSGIFEWGGSSQSPISADALRIQIYSDGANDLVSIHLRGRGGISNSINDSETATKATLIQYVPTELEERPFVTTWKTDNPGVSEDNQITIPTFPEETYNYNVDWGDGNFDTGITGDVTHTYATAGTYQVSISGEFPRIYFKKFNGTEKLVSVDQWGDNQWTSMEGAFSFTNMELKAVDVPDLSGVTSMKEMFLAGLSNGGAILNNWDVSTIQDMSYALADVFENLDLSNWDVRNVTNMEGLFFNGSGSREISTWNVSKVTNMSYMFHNMLVAADLSNWNVGQVTDFSFMFLTASFDQDIGSWDVSSALNMANMFDGTRLSLENYDNTLVGWSIKQLQNGVVFDGGNSQYCQGEEARQKLIDDFGWSIIDGGKSEDCPEPEDFSVTGFTLVLGDREFILEDGERYRNDQAGTPFIFILSGEAGSDIRATTIGNIGSIFFELSGPTEEFDRIDNDSEFTLYGQTEMYYYPSGFYTLTATPYSGEDLTGEAGVPFSITFESFSQCQELKDQVYVETISADCDGNGGTVFVYNSLGTGGDVDSDKYEYDVELQRSVRAELAPGSYSVFLGSPNCGITVDYVIKQEPNCEEPNTDDIWLEAECATVGSNWSFVSDSSASNGEYVLPPSGFSSSGSDNADNIVKFDFNATADTYNIYTLVKTPNTSDDSFYIRVNGGLWRRWNNIPQVNSFQWNQIHDRELVNVPLSFNLFDGINTLEIANREDGAGLDKVLITKSNTIPSGFGVSDATCGSDLSGRSSVANSSILSPNPVVHTTSLSFEKPVQLTTIKVYDITGRLVHTYDVKKTEDQGSYILNVATLPAGTYFLKSQDTKGQSHQKQMVIKK